jgi:hypothetical protein
MRHCINLWIAAGSNLFLWPTLQVLLAYLLMVSLCYFALGTQTSTESGTGSLTLNFISNSMKESRDSSVGIALGYGLDDWGSRVRFPAGAGNFSLHVHVRNGSGAHTVSYPIGTRVSFPEGKAAGA